MKWLHSRIYGMIQVLVCVLVHVIHHMAQNMATVYTIHKKYFIYLNTRLFPNSPEKEESSSYTVVMYSGKYVSLSRINTVRYVQKYYCKTLPPEKMDSVKKLIWWLSHWIRMCWQVIFNYNITVLKHPFTR